MTWMRDEHGGRMAIAIWLTHLDDLALLTLVLTPDDQDLVVLSDGHRSNLKRDDV